MDVQRAIAYVAPMATEVSRDGACRAAHACEVEENRGGLLTAGRASRIVAILVCVNLAILVWNSAVFDGASYDQTRHAARANPDARFSSIHR